MSAKNAYKERGNATASCEGILYAVVKHGNIHTILILDCGHQLSACLHYEYSDTSAIQR